MRTAKETPPLARRKRAVREEDFAFDGNTSACAEKTNVLKIYSYFIWKHLRLRGENSLQSELDALSIETPPLARRKLLPTTRIEMAIRNTSACAEKTLSWQNHWEDYGNTSACAEKTTSKNHFSDPGRKHLRLRGENLEKLVIQIKYIETPPLARRKHQSSKVQ